jgi:hypothetical protein
VKFLKWAVTDGQQYAAPLFYATVLTREMAQINEINLGKQASAK